MMSLPGKDVLCDKDAFCLSLFSGTLMAKSTGTFVNRETTSNDINSLSASRVLPTSIKSENSKEFLTVLSVFSTIGDKTYAK